MKLKKLLALLLSVCMLMSAFAAYASEEAIEPDYLFSSVAFTYSGEDADSLVGGETLTATVTADGSAGDSLTFALVVTKNGKVVAADNSTKSLSGETTFEAEVVLPDDVSGVEVKAVVWEGYNNMKPVLTSSVMPSSDASLTYISVDGTELEGFDPEITEYTYLVEDPARTDVPKIKIKAANSGSKVEIADPTWYPGKSVITVTAPDGTKKEYNINYKVEDAPFVENLRVLEDNTLPDGTPIQRPVEYIYNGVRLQGRIYGDRDALLITEINGESIEGGSIIVTNNDWQNGEGKIGEECTLYRNGGTLKWIQFEATRGLTVRVFNQNASKPERFTELGYVLEKDNTNYIVGEGKWHYGTVYSRHFNAGETAYIPNGVSINVVPSVIIAHDPFGATSSSLSEITVDGNALEDFDANKYDYTYELSADTLIAPEVMAIAADERAHVSITAPDTFPGKSVITVTAPGCETATYTITYTCTTTLADNIVGDPDVTGWQTHNGNTHNNRSELPAIYHNLQVGNTNLVHDRIQDNGKAVAVDESLLGRDYISAGHDWHSGSPNGDFDEVYKDSSKLNPDWYSFDLHRSADVKVIFKTDPYETTVGSSIEGLQIMDGNKLPDGTAIDPSKHVKYVAGGFKEGCQHVADRTFTLSGITDTDLFGSDMIYYAYESYKDGDAVQDYVVANHNVDDTPGIVNWINFTVNRDAEIYVYTSLPKGQQTDNDRALEAAGFEHVTEAGTTYATSSVAIANKTYSGKWKKEVSAGETVNLPSNRSGSAQGRVTPFAVIKYTSELPLLPEEDIVPLNNGFIAEHLKSLGYKFQHKDSGYFIQAFTPCGRANCDGMYSKHFEVANGETVTISMPSFIDREFFVVLDYAGIEGEDYDNGVVIEEDKIPLDIVSFDGDFLKADAKVKGYSISDADGTLTVNIADSKAKGGETVGFALLRPGKNYKDKYKGKEIVSDMVALTELTLDEDGMASYVTDMTGEDSGYYIPVIDGVVQNGKIFFATSEDRGDMYEEIKDILDGKDIPEGKTVQSVLIEKLDSANKESLAINTLAVVNEKLSTVDEEVYAKAVLALYGEDKSNVTNADTMKELLTDAALIALMDEGKEDIANVMVSAGIKEKYADLYNEELSADTKKTFTKDYFAGKGIYTKEAISEAFEEAVVLSFVKDINTQSDAEKLILEFGEDIGIDVEDYKDLKTKQKNNVKDYIIDNLGSVTSADNLADKINSEIEDQADSSSGSRGGSGGGGGSTGGAGVFAGSEPVVAVNPEQQVTGFADMAGFTWAEDAVNALYEDGVVSGIGNNMFAPQNAVTREEMLTMLLRAYKVDVTGAVSTFADVPANVWYNAYVAKGFELGVTSGVDSENFGSGRAVTRAEAAAMAYRIATHFGNTFTPETALFNDDAVIAPWAKEAVYALKGSLVINGTGDGSFAPQKGCTRAEAAKIVYGLINR